MSTRLRHWPYLRAVLLLAALLTYTVRSDNWGRDDCMSVLNRPPVTVVDVP